MPGGTPPGRQATAPVRHRIVAIALTEPVGHITFGAQRDQPLPLQQFGGHLDRVLGARLATEYAGLQVAQARWAEDDFPPSNEA